MKAYRNENRRTFAIVRHDEYWKRGWTAFPLVLSICRARLVEASDISASELTLLTKPLGVRLTQAFRDSGRLTSTSAKAVTW
jgi:hypothetical protein